MASPTQQQVRSNRQIRAREVRVIDDAGEQLGILQTIDALRLAQERGLDLVEVSPNVDPPVCRIMDFGKYKYEQQKKQQTARKKSALVQIKEIKFRPKTDDHDFLTKVKHIRRFLEEGDRCKAIIFFRGREVVHKDRGLLILQRVAQELKDIAKVEQEPQFEGRTMNMMLVPLVRKVERPEKPAQPVAPARPAQAQAEQPAPAEQVAPTEQAAPAEQAAPVAPAADSIE